MGLTEIILHFGKNFAMQHKMLIAHGGNVQHVCLNLDTSMNPHRWSITIGS